MSNFNEFFRNKGAAIMVERFHSGADGWSKTHKITNLRYEIVDEEPHPSSYYIENGLTASHRVVITYDLDNDGIDRYSEFEVPREIDGIFILEGAYRVANNKLGNDYDCRMRLTGVGEHIVNFDYDRQYLVDKKVLKIKRINETLGIPDKSLEIPYELIDETLEDPVKKELLKLTPKQTKKFQIKLDLDYVPEYITRKLIDDSIAFGDDRDLDLIIDKSIDSAAQGFMQYLFRDNNGRNFRSVRNRIMTYFSKWGKLQEQSNSITSLCFRFWKGNSGATSKEIVVPPGVNAINLESQRTKITIPETVAYNASFSDLIDIADTPINQNTNLQNALTVSTHLTDDAVLFDVYDKNFNKITIDYLDYLNSKVVASEYVNYETNTLMPTEEGKLEVKHRMKRKWVDKGDFDLIDLSPDYRLSETSRQIPFLNATDSVRISMGTSMLKQAIPLANAQRPLVGTGNYEELKENVLNSRFKYPEGKVIEINEDDIIIEVKGENKEVKIPRRTAIQSLNDVAVFTEPKVKVGDIVKEGDVISGAHEITKDSVNVGLNTLVLYSAYKGLVHEDAVVVSESYSDRMCSYGFIDLQIDVKTSTALKWIAPIGTKVKSREPVVTLYKAIKLDAINQLLHDKLGSVVKDENGKGIQDYTREQYLTVPNNIDEAIVSDVMIQENIKPVLPKNIKTPDFTFARSSAEEIDKYNESKDRKPIYDRFPEYIASDTLDPIEMDPKEYKTVYTIRVRLIKITRLLVGSKLTNRYGGKGVVSAILPDNEMPLVDGKPCELIMNPYSTIKSQVSLWNVSWGMLRLRYMI